MIRSLAAFSTALALCPIGVYLAGGSAASPPAPGGAGVCNFAFDGPRVVGLSGVPYVEAGLHFTECTVRAHATTTVCLSVEGGDSAGLCQTHGATVPTFVYYPYQPGTTYIATGKGCYATLQDDDSPAEPATYCADIPDKRVRL
jgi:hypothetical protein